jgi:hypothetical protein
MKIVGHWAEISSRIFWIYSRSANHFNTMFCVQDTIEDCKTGTDLHM